LANTAWAISAIEMQNLERLLHAISADALKRLGGVLWQPFFDCVDVFSLESSVKL